MPTSRDGVYIFSAISVDMHTVTHCMWRPNNWPLIAV